MFGVYVLLLASTALLFNKVPGGFIPTQDKLFLFSGAKLPEGAAHARTNDVTSKMIEVAPSVDG